MQPSDSSQPTSLQKVEPKLGPQKRQERPHEAGWTLRPVQDCGLPRPGYPANPTHPFRVTQALCLDKAPPPFPGFQGNPAFSVHHVLGPRAAGRATSGSGGHCASPGLCSTAPPPPTATARASREKRCGGPPHFWPRGESTRGSRGRSTTKRSSSGPKCTLPIGAPCPSRGPPGVRHQWAHLEFQPWTGGVSGAPLRACAPRTQRDSQPRPARPLGVQRQPRPGPALPDRPRPPRRPTAHPPRTRLAAWLRAATPAAGAAGLATPAAGSPAGLSPVPVTAPPPLSASLSIPACLPPACPSVGASAAATGAAAAAEPAPRALGHTLARAAPTPNQQRPLSSHSRACRPISGGPCLAAATCLYVGAGAARPRPWSRSPRSHWPRAQLRCAAATWGWELLLRPAGRGRWTGRLGAGPAGFAHWKCRAAELQLEGERGAWKAGDAVHLSRGGKAALEPARGVGLACGEERSGGETWSRGRGAQPPPSPPRNVREIRWAALVRPSASFFPRTENAFAAPSQQGRWKERQVRFTLVRSGEESHALFPESLGPSAVGASRTQGYFRQDYGYGATAVYAFLPCSYYSPFYIFEGTLM